MKFIRLVVTFLIMIALCLGCKEKEDCKQIPTAAVGYTCKAEITYDADFSAVAKVFALGGGVTEIELVYPEKLGGMKFSLDRENTVVTYKGLKCSANISKEFGGFVWLIGRAFLKLGTGEPTAVKKGEKWIFDGSDMSVDFVFILNDEGLPLKLDIPSKKIIAEFSQWQYTK